MRLQTEKRSYVLAEMEEIKMSQKLVVCSDCGAINRLPPTRAATAAKCGKCSARLFGAAPKDVAMGLFERQVAHGTLPVLVDVWAPWCGPCRAMAPEFETASRQLEPEVRLIKLNSEAQPAATAKLGIRGIPTMILFQGGRELARVSGAMTAGAIVQWVRERLPAAA